MRPFLSNTSRSGHPVENLSASFNVARLSLLHSLAKWRSSSLSKTTSTTYTDPRYLYGSDRIGIIH